MRPNKGVTRLLAILLILRVLAAPVGVRTQGHHAAGHDRFTVRFCAWPAQRPHRLAFVSTYLPGYRNFGYDASTRLIPVAEALATGSLSRAHLSHSVRLATQPSSAVHLTDCPRC